MTALPAALAPWAPMLGLFPEDVAGELGRWIPRIALAIGPMRTARPEGRGDPDGFAGLARRGSYERLLLTEWLLADEAPEEFARRAAMGEHAFFAIARRSPVRAASSIGIFDAGPDQIGAPRIAALAALIVLAERAARAGARFAWGVLHDPAGALVPSVTPEAVLRLLAARSALPASADDLAAWDERAGKSGWEDVWIVGPRPSTAPRAGPHPPGGRARHGALEIRDVLDPARRALTLVARPPSGAPREIDLDLPPPAACVRLLRDPFTVTAPPAPRVQRADLAPASNLVFAPNGTKLFARLAEGEIVAYTVPASPNDVVARPKRYRRPKAGPIAGVGWVSRSLVTLSIREDALVFEKSSHRGPDLLDRVVPRPKDLPIAAPGPFDPLSPIYCLCPEARTLVLFMDARRALFLVKADPTPRVTCVATEVAAIACVREKCAYVGRMSGGSPTRHRPGDTLPPMTVPELSAAWALAVVSGQVEASSLDALPGDGSFAACFGFEADARSKGLVAVQQVADAWVFVDDRVPSRVTITPPEGALVVGTYRGARDAEPELVVLEEDRRTLRRVSRSQGRALPRAPAPIVDVTMSTARPQLAYVTATGEVVILSLAHEAVVARFAPP